LVFIGKKALAIKKHLKDSGVGKAKGHFLPKMSSAFLAGALDGRESSFDKKKKAKKLQGDLL
jgi:hypothetical protein